MLLSLDTNRRAAIRVNCRFCVYSIPRDGLQRSGFKLLRPITHPRPSSPHIYIHSLYNRPLLCVRAYLSIHSLSLLAPAPLPFVFSPLSAIDTFFSKVPHGLPCAANSGREPPDGVRTAASQAGAGPEPSLSLSPHFDSTRHDSPLRFSIHPSNPSHPTQRPYLLASYPAPLPHFLIVPRPVQLPLTLSMSVRRNAEFTMMTRFWSAC